MLRALIGAFGLVELLAPGPIVDCSVRLAVEDSDEVELRDWVYTAARVEGALILAWACWSGMRKRRRRRMQSG